MEEEVFDSPYVVMKIENSIIFGIYKKVTIDLDSAKIIAKNRIDFLKGRSYPAFVDLRAVKLVTKEARNYLSKESGTSGLIAIGILAGNRLTVFMANLYMKFDKPKVPTRVFLTRERVLEWLRPFAEKIDVKTT